MEQFLAIEREKEPVKRSEEEIDALVEELLSKMTLEEKIGQMTQSGGLDTSAIGNEVEQQLPLKEQIRRGLLGSMIAMASPVDLFELQKLAVEESRLGIPLLYCRDVIHGQETVFPIPLAWACSFDPGLVQEAAAAAAREASSHRCHGCLRSDAGHRQRSPLGPDRRGTRGGPLPGCPDGGGCRARLPGR